MALAAKAWLGVVLLCAKENDCSEMYTYSFAEDILYQAYQTWFGIIQEEGLYHDMPSPVEAIRTIHNLRRTHCVLHEETMVIQQEKMDAFRDWHKRLIEECGSSVITRLLDVLQNESTKKKWSS